MSTINTNALILAALVGAAIAVIPTALGADAGVFFIAMLAAVAIVGFAELRDHS